MWLFDQALAPVEKGNAGQRHVGVRQTDDFQVALREDGVLGMLITGPGRFLARLTQITLHRLRLSAAEEHLPRIAFVAVPADAVLVLLPVGGGAPSIWGGIAIGASEIVTLGPDQRVHSRTDRPSRWGAIRLPARDLARYGRAMSGEGFTVPEIVARWQPQPAAGRELRGLHRAAIRAGEIRAGMLVDGEAAHGMEQQLIHALVESLSAGPLEEHKSAQRHRDVLARFEGLLQMQPFFRVDEICVALGVFAGMLRKGCEEHMGMSRAATFASTGFSRCTAHCAAEIRTRRASRRLHVGTECATSVLLPPAIAPSMANCHPSPCAGAQARVITRRPMLLILNHTDQG